MNIQENYFKVPNDIFDLELSVYEFTVLSLLMRYENNNDYSFPSYNHIAKKCNISRRKAIDTINILESKGLIVKTIRPSEYMDNDSNIYEVVHDMHHPSAQYAPNKEQCIKNNNLHHSQANDDLDFSSILWVIYEVGDNITIANVLNLYSIKRFDKAIRQCKHDYDFEQLEHLTVRELVEFLNDNIKQYDRCNLDYLYSIQLRAL